MKSIPRIALWLGACVTAVLTVWAAFAIFNMWFLVPLDSMLTQGQAIRTRLEWEAIFVVAFFVFGSLSRLAFRKARKKTKYSPTARQ
jgi:hypothetical protein